MTGGVAVILGETGRNFGAGMSGGVAYVYDPGEIFEDRLNPHMVRLDRVAGGIDEELLKALVERHAALTGSPLGHALLDDWSGALAAFWKVSPHPSVEDATAEEQDERELEAAALQDVRRESGVPVAEAG
jgi:glutamate synthase domain-containing protein 3